MYREPTHVILSHPSNRSVLVPFISIFSFLILPRVNVNCYSSRSRSKFNARILHEELIRNLINVTILYIYICMYMYTQAEIFLIDLIRKYNELFVEFRFDPF